jgi:CHRD domain
MKLRWFTTLILASAFAASASAQSVFTAFLDGAQENPPVPTANTGTGSFLLDPFTNVLTYNITITGLTGGYTASHIHTGAVGANGGVTFNIGPGPANFSGTVGPLSAAQLTTLRNSGFYVNIHSGSFGGGEIRGQITPARDQCIVVLSGLKEVPPNPSAATGEGTLTLNAANQIVYDITFSGLTGGFVAAHIHDGAAGANGGVLFTLTSVGPGQLMGTTVALNGSQRAKFRAGQLYVNVHSGAFGGGEIRGQTAASFTPYGNGCPHPGGFATLSGSGVTRPGGSIGITVSNGMPTNGILFVSIAGFNGSIGFGCPFLVHPAVLLSVPLGLPAPNFTLPSLLPTTVTAGTVVNMQYIGNQGGGVPYATNGLQMNITN